MEKPDKKQDNNSTGQAKEFVPVQVEIIKTEQDIIRTSSWYDVLENLYPDIFM